MPHSILRGGLLELLSRPRISTITGVRPDDEKMKSYGGHSMVGDLLRVLVCAPAAAGWSDPEKARHWQELGYFHSPSFVKAQTQHREMTEVLGEMEAEIIFLPEGGNLSPDAVYAHDASLMTDHGAILMEMGKVARRGEPAWHGRLYESLDIPILGTIEPPGTTEAGDLVWLDEKTLLVGLGHRTNEAGIEQLRALLGPKGVDVITAPLPYGAGPSACLHLMSLMSLLDEGTMLVDLAWLSVPTVEFLKKKGYRFIEIHASERETMACNVLSLGKKTLLALEENEKTNERLREYGFDVKTFPGSEICQSGGGGPTCLTRPIWRSG
jgi:N-dimethylarginine dimethylaminohydrolase